jgi:hypothetical protein
LLHLKILDADENFCILALTMIEEDHKPFSFLLQQKTSEMSKRRKENNVYPHSLDAPHDFYLRLATFTKKSSTFSKNRDFFKRGKIAIFMGRFFGKQKKSRLFEKVVIFPRFFQHYLKPLHAHFFLPFTQQADTFLRLAIFS